MSYPDSVAFVHSYLDEYGLDPYEFRVFSHIVRRTGGKLDGECFASNETIAEMCNMSPRKVQLVLKTLVAFGMIEQFTKRGRRTKTWRLRHCMNWVPKSQHDHLRKVATASKKDLLLTLC